MGDSTTGGTEGPIFRRDPPLRDVCHFPGAQVKDITKRLTSLVQPLDYYPLLVLHLDVATHNLRAIKMDFKDLG